MDAVADRLVGRQRELLELNELLDRARAERVARIVRISGVSGIGKTTLARAVVNSADASGWLTISVVCHRIQASLPFVTARKLVTGLTTSLGPGAQRYTSGLEAEISRAISPGSPDVRAIEDVILRLLEAIALDRPLLLTIDDAHWADSESKTLLVRVLQTLSDFPIVIMGVERSEDTQRPSFEPCDLVVVLHELDLRSMEELSTLLLPGASEDVIRFVAQQARGRAIDVVELSKTTADPSSMTPQDVGATLRARIARELLLLDADTREFLQVCSLISDPIEYDVLKELWPNEERLLQLIERCAGRFLTQESDGLHFVHGAVSQSISETVAIQIPYRRRIIEALQRVAAPGLEHFERLVDQAAATGDRELERSFLRELVGEAERRRVVPAVASGVERLLSLTSFNPEASLPLYERLSIAYNTLARDTDAHRVCSEALSLAIAHGVEKGLGQLVVSDLFSLLMRGERIDFDRTVAQFDAYLKDVGDRSQLIGPKLLAALFDYDNAAFDRIKNEYSAIAGRNPLLDIRVESLEAMRKACNGDPDGAAATLQHARSLAQQRNAIRIEIADSADAIIASQSLGFEHPTTLGAIERLRQADLKTYLNALAALSHGNVEDTLQQVTEGLVHIDGVHARRMQLSVAAMAASLSGQLLPQALAAEIERDAFLLGRTATGWLLPMALYVGITAAAAARAREANAIVASVRDILTHKPVEPMVVFYPICLVRVAAITRDRETLEIIAQGKLRHNRLALNIAHGAFARLAAQRELGATVAAIDVDDVATTFTRLGSPYFATLARGMKENAPATSQKIPEPGVTRREREVAALVSEGLTNREIAERLVLSERTVEAHLANIFGKIGVSSRTQVATWFARLPGTR